MSIEPNEIITPWGSMTMAAIEEKVTDGYHSIKELYQHLDALFAKLCVARKDHCWKTRLSTVTELSDIPELMIGLDIGPDKHIAWYLPLPIWERLGIRELDYIPGWSTDMVHYSLSTHESAEWLLGQPMPPIKGEEIPNYGTINTPEGAALVPKSLLNTTFNELYALRHALFIALSHEHLDKAWKSLVHEDGSMFDDYFIAGIGFAEGVVTYHLPLELWSMLDVTELKASPTWDGHTASDVVDRLLQVLD